MAINLYTTGHGARIDSRRALQLLKDDAMRRNAYVRLVAETFNVSERAAQMRVKEFVAQGLVREEGTPRMVLITDAGRSFRGGFRRGGDSIRAIVARTPANAYSKRQRLSRLDLIPNRRPEGAPPSSPPYMVLSADRIGVPIEDEWPQLEPGWYGIPMVVGARWPRKGETELVIAAVEPVGNDTDGQPSRYQIWGRFEP